VRHLYVVTRTIREETVIEASSDKEAQKLAKAVLKDKVAALAAWAPVPFSAKFAGLERYEEEE